MDRKNICVFMYDLFFTRLIDEIDFEQRDDIIGISYFFNMLIIKQTICQCCLYFILIT